MISVILFFKDELTGDMLILNPENGRGLIITNKPVPQGNETILSARKLQKKAAEGKSIQGLN